MFRKTAIAVALIGAFLSVGSVAPLQARDHHDKCEQRVRKAEQNLDKALRKHGEHSRKAEQRRRELEQARANCRVDQHDGSHHDHDHR